MVVLAGEDRQQHRGVTLKVFKLWREREISGGEKKKNNLGYLKRERGISGPPKLFYY